MGERIHVGFDGSGATYCDYGWSPAQFTENTTMLRPGQFIADPYQHPQTPMERVQYSQMLLQVGPTYRYCYNMRFSRGCGEMMAGIHL